MCDSEFSDRLLSWYDEHARDLPWRISPADRQLGVCPDPYRVWLSEIMLQQTTVAAVRPYFESFVQRWKTVHELAQAKDEDLMAAWAGLGYYARARNLLKCARIVSRELGGTFPSDQAGLMKLPGIGPYTSAAIAAISYDQPTTVVDGNVERVMARYFAIDDPLPSAKPHLWDAAKETTPNNRPGDHAQAVMDLGATVCTPKGPQCGICPIAKSCAARRQGIASDLPKRSAKVEKPTRYGTVWIARRNDGAWLLERRPNSGLLGGMLGWPGSVWAELNDGEHEPPIAADWKPMNTQVRHTFTHFHLRLDVMTACVDDNASPKIGNFIADTTFSKSDLPTVMRKAFDLAIANLGQT